MTHPIPDLLFGSELQSFKTKSILLYTFKNAFQTKKLTEENMSNLSSSISWFLKKKFWKIVCFVLKFVDILGGQENVARDDKILVRD
jgi:hypothetical protein